MHTWPPHASNWPLAFFLFPAPVAPSLQHLLLGSVPLMPIFISYQPALGTTVPKTGSSCKRLFLPSTSWRVTHALLEKAPGEQVILGTLPSALWSGQQEKMFLHFPASDWESFACFGMGSDWCMCWESGADHKLAANRMGLSLSVIQGWFHLVTPSGSTLCTERIKVFGGVHRVFYLIIILRRKA